MELSVVVEQDESVLQHRESFLLEGFPREGVEGELVLQGRELHHLWTPPNVPVCHRGQNPPDPNIAPDRTVPTHDVFRRVCSLTYPRF